MNSRLAPILLFDAPQQADTQMIPYNRDFTVDDLLYPDISGVVGD